MTRKEMTSVLFTWIVPLKLVVGYIYFFTILNWLTQIDHQHKRWFEVDQALSLLFSAVFALCGSGLVFAHIKMKDGLLSVYVSLFIVACGLLILIWLLSGSSKT